MFRFSNSILVNRALADVWQVLIDFPQVPSWEQGVLEVRQTSPGAPIVGTTLIARRVYFGRETLIDCRITAWEELWGSRWPCVVGRCGRPPSGTQSRPQTARRRW